MGLYTHIMFGAHRQVSLLRCLVIVVGLFGHAYLVGCGPPDPPPHPVPAGTVNAQREQDLDYLVATIEHIHPKPFLRIQETNFKEIVEEVRLSIPELDDAGFHLALSRVLASIQDAHCALEVFNSSAYPIVSSLNTEAFDEGWFVVSCTGGHSDLLASRVVSIDGQPCEKLVDRCSEYIPAANAHRVVYRAPRWLMAPGFLHALGLCAEADRYTIEFELPSGEHISRDFLSGELDSKSGVHVLSGKEDLPRSIHPQSHETGAPYWWTYEPDNRLLYLQYNAVHTHDDYPFEDMVDSFLDRIDQGGVDVVVVDVRYNGGGNNSLIEPLDRGLAMRARRGDLGTLYVLTSGRTFSSGVDVGVHLRDNAGATVVGTPTGGMPNSFGNAVPFILPNSKIKGRCSSGYFRLVDGEPPTLEPHELLGRPWADYSIGRDTAMGWVRAHGNERTTTPP